MATATPSPDAVLASVADLAPPGTPLTTAEVADEFDCTTRTIYNRLEALAEEGPLATKKVGARGRVWWRPPADAASTDDLYRRLFAEAGEGVLVADVVFEDGEAVDVLYREANDAMTRLSEDLAGRWLTEIGPEFEAEILDLYGRVLRTGEAKRVELHAESRGKWYEFFVFRPEEGPGRRIAARVRDVTERRRAQQRLEQERDMFAEGPTIVFRWTPEEDEGWPVEYVSENVEAVLGYAAEDLESGAVPYSDLLLDEELERIAAEVEEATERGAERFSHDPYRVRTADGDVRWVKDVTKIVRDGTGEVEHYLGYLVDVTERKRREERSRFLVELNDALQPLSDPDAIMAAATELLGDHLDAGRVGYCEVGPEGRHVEVETEWIDDGGAPTSDETMGRLYADAREWFESGRTRVVTDVQAEPLPSTPEARERYQAWGCRATVGVPLVKAGEWTAVLYVNDPAVREWTETEVDLVEDVAERTWAAVERARAEAELKRTNDGLERLTAASRSLMEADEEALCDRAAGVVRHVLGVEYAALWRYDGSDGELRRRSVHTGPGTDLGTVRPPERFRERVWETFVGGDPAVVDAPAAAEGSDSPLAECVLVPLARHGVVCAGSVRRIDDRTLDLARTAAATVETAWDRAAGERRLAERNEELQRLDRLNGLIRGIDQALVEAEDRAAIDRAVCERLADSDQYVFAWIGERDPVADAVVPREWAGVDDGYVEAVQARPADEDPVATAAHTGDLQVVADVATDPRADAWRGPALERGARSCIAIPLVYGESTYGVLAVYADHPQPDERDHAVLAELGETIAHAVDAVETKRTLLTDSVTELTLEHPGDGDPIADLARRVGCRVEFDGVVPRLDGEKRVFLRATGSTDAVLDAARAHPRIVEARPIRDEDAETAVEATVTGPTLAGHVVDGGLVRSLTATPEETTVVVDLPGGASVREFVEGVRETYPDLRLAARSTRDRPIATRQDLREALSEALTDRQREVLETAYFSGYFESPRARTGGDLADALGVSQSTFTYHLRAAQRGLCELVFENA